MHVQRNQYWNRIPRHRTDLLETLEAHAKDQQACHVFENKCPIHRHGAMLIQKGSRSDSSSEFEVSSKGHLLMAKGANLLMCLDGPVRLTSAKVFR